MRGYLSAIIAAISIGVLAVFFTSQRPDGLEQVSGRIGFASKAVEQSAVMAGYTTPAIQTGKISSSIAVTAGIVLLFALFFLLGELLKFRNNNHENK